ncbi:hypothetical protein [Amycolatopsis sulphurea]|nr:hypothetical protein [Amycolatopsis sulphurea]
MADSIEYASFRLVSDIPASQVLDSVALFVASSKLESSSRRAHR